MREEGHSEDYGADTNRWERTRKSELKSQFQDLYFLNNKDYQKYSLKCYSIVFIKNTYFLNPCFIEPNILLQYF